LSQRAAWTGGLLFLVFPGGVEAVECTCDLPDVLMTTAVLVFVLLCTAPQVDRTRFLGAGLALAVALATKETAVCAPMLAAIVASGQSPNRRRWALIGLAFCMAGGYALWRLTTVHLPVTYAVAPTRYVLKEMAVRPLATLIVPWRRAELVRAPSLGIVSALALVLLITHQATGWSRHSSDFKRTLRLAAWVFAAAAPVYAFLFIGDDLQNSRYLYLPSCGWVLAVALLLDAELVRFRAARILIPLVGFLIGVWTYGVIVHLRSWEHAANVRDAILAGAARTIKETDCETVTFDQLPWEVEGAWTFWNGFPEALQLELGAAVRIATVSSAHDTAGHYSPATIRVVNRDLAWSGVQASSSCHRAWDGSGFEDGRKQ
jgi:hypothetical protein